jgi:hypothetical protein
MEVSMAKKSEQGEIEERDDMGTFLSLTNGP